MKVAHHKKLTQSAHDWLVLAKNYEEEDELAKAAMAYEKALKTRKREEKIYDRLMILYRKLKDPQNELRVVNAGINTFEQTYNRTHRSPGKRISNLSRALLKATGLVSKKGESLYQPQPLGRWKKRKLTILNKLKK